MKKFTIFIILLFFVTAVWYHPSRVSVGTGVTERFIERLSVFEDSANSASIHVDLLTELKTELEFLELRYTSIPDTFNQAGTITGIFTLLETLTITILDVVAVPLYILGTLVVFIIDAIILIFNLLSLLDLFTIKV